MMTKCPECGKDVSNSAAACPSCGFAVSRHVLKEKAKLTPKEKAGCLGLVGVVFLGLALLCGIGLIQTFFFFKPVTRDQYYLDSHGLTQNPGYSLPDSPEAQRKSKIENFGTKGIVFFLVGSGLLTACYFTGNQRKAEPFPNEGRSA